jgi:hypothetical protein
MTWATALDRLNETVCDTFPASATHTPVVGPEQTGLTVVHDYRWIELVTSENPAVSAQRHVAFVRLADFTTAPVQGDALTVDGTGYEVTDVQADGGGGAVLILMVT